MSCTIVLLIAALVPTTCPKWPYQAAFCPTCYHGETLMDPSDMYMADTIRTAPFRAQQCERPLHVSVGHGVSHESYHKSDQTVSSFLQGHQNTRRSLSRCDCHPSIEILPTTHTTASPEAPPPQAPPDPESSRPLSPPPSFPTPRCFDYIPLPLHVPLV